jgi:hypothetical protein
VKFTELLVCGAKPPNMKNKNLIRFAGSFILFPALMISTPFGDTPKNDIDITTQAPQIVLSKKHNIEVFNLFAFNQAVDEEAQILKAKADAIDTYFKKYDMPLAGTGMKMILEAEKNGLDWRLLPAIAVRESTGGKFKCKKVENSFFGWGSCRIGFNSTDEAIEIVARNIGGNNPKTAYHYKGKDTKEILQTYNPPSIVARSAQQVMSIMEAISPRDIKIDDVGVSNT